jgi:methyl-accepting chemotaxis protein
MTVLAFQLSNETSLFWILLIIAICFIVMAAAMATLAFTVLSAVRKVMELQQRVEPLIKSVNNISLQGREIAEKFSDLSEHLTVATKHFADSAGLIKEEVAEIKGLLGDTTVTAKRNVALVTQTIERTNGQVIETADYIQTKVVEPARELAAIMAGFKRGLEVLLAPSPKQLDRAYGDDEMFIG